MLSRALPSRVFHLEVGDRVWLSPKFSYLFTWDELPGDQHLVLDSAGTGFAPYMSMLRTQLTCDGPCRFVVLHSATNWTWIVVMR